MIPKRDVLIFKNIVKAVRHYHALQMANERIGPWLSAALDDPNVCAEMKADLKAWFEAQEIE